MVGDPHQQIYGFRGAINAMELVQATRTFYLTQVFVPHVIVILGYTRVQHNHRRHVRPSALGRFGHFASDLVIYSDIARVISLRSIIIIVH